MVMKGNTKEESLQVGVQGAPQTSAQITAGKFPRRHPPVSLPKAILLETTKPPPY